MLKFLSGNPHSQERRTENCALIVQKVVLIVVEILLLRKWENETGNIFFLQFVRNGFACDFIDVDCRVI